MRLTTSLLSLTAALALIAAPLSAEEGAAKGKGCGNGQLKAKVLERFDTDKDGKLSETERAAAKAAHDAKKAERRAKVDTDGNGEVSDAEKAAARAAFSAKLKEKHPEAYAKIDTNGDGTISKEEGKAARDARKERCGKGDGKGEGKGKKHGGKPGNDGQTSVQE